MIASIRDGNPFRQSSFIHRLQQPFRHRRLLKLTLFYYFGYRYHLYGIRTGDRYSVSRLSGDVAAQHSSIFESEHIHAVVLRQYRAWIDKVLQQVVQVLAITAVERWA